MSSVLAEIYRHNRWANEQLLLACAALDARVLEATAVGTFGSIHRTLWHIVGAEERYVTRLGTTLPFAPLERDAAVPDIAELRRRSAATGDALVEIALRARSNRVLRGEYNGQPYAMPASTILIQAINHATEHRAQVATVMTQQGVQPPELDGWSYGEAMRR